MGNFYANLTVRCCNPAAVAILLRGRNAIVTPARNGCVVVADEAAEREGRAALQALACTVSAGLFCGVLAVGNDDDAVLWYALAVNGLIVDEYVSRAAPETATGDPERLCAAFGASDPARVAAILRGAGHEAPGFVFESERHAELATALKLPAYCVGLGFANMVASALPEGVTPEQLIYIS